jgi:hypothetical protein
MVEVAPTDAAKAGQIRDDRAVQLIERIVEGRACIGLDQKGFDGSEAHQEAVSQLSPVERVSATWLSGFAGGRNGFAGVCHGTLRPTLLVPGDCGIGGQGTPGHDVGQTATGVFKQQQMDALAFQPAVIVQAVGVDQGHVAFTVLGDDLFGASLGLVGEFGKIGACLGEGHCITGRKTHGSLPRGWVDNRILYSLSHQVGCCEAGHSSRR